jgi:uncharacterized protein (TIGR00297 family)
MVGYVHVLGVASSGIFRWATGGLLTLLFAGVALRLRGVTRSGAAAGTIIGLVLYLGGGAAALAALIMVFVLALISTRLGYSHKQKLGVAEPREGRTASQVLANLGVAAVCAALYACRGQPPLLRLALAAALSEAAADTVSSEVGQAFGRKAWLITTWDSVLAGTNGAVSVPGTLAGAAAGAVVTLVCIFGRLIPRHWLTASLGAAILGMVVDSFLGAWLERRGWLNNHAVNFLSTLVAAAAASWFT